MLSLSYLCGYYITLCGVSVVIKRDWRAYGINWTIDYLRFIK